MANESGRPPGTTSGPDEPESRPISVSELLARSRAADAAQAADAGQTRENRGRRRIGREGAVSVSELTGEIPRVDTGRFRAPAADPGSAARSAQPSAEPRPSAPAPKPETSRPTPAPEVARTEAPESARTASSSPAFPRSANPVARRLGDDRPTPARPDRDAVRPGDPGRTASGMPRHPETRDFAGSDIAARLDAIRRSDESANEVTNIIPVVGDDRDDLVVVESDDVAVADLATGSGEVIDDFESYRNFSDVEEDEEPRTDRRRLFGRRKGRPEPEAPVRQAFTVDIPETDGPVVDDRPPADETGTGPIEDIDDIRDTDLVSPAEADDHTAMADAVDADEQPAIRPTSVPKKRPAKDTKKADAPGGGRLAGLWSKLNSTEERAPRKERSPVAAWLIIGVQAIIGLAIGVGLFLGFKELWYWNAYFALVLAVVVIFGVVTFAHVVSRTKDLMTTLLALAVGLIVTIGPLVLLV